MKYRTINGGGGSSFKKLMLGSSKGPIKTTLIGSMIVATFLFQATLDSSPNKESGGLGNPLGPVVPKSEVVTKRKTNPEIINRMTNFVFEIFILKLGKSNTIPSPLIIAFHFFRQKERAGK